MCQFGMCSSSKGWILLYRAFLFLTFHFVLYHSRMPIRQGPQLAQGRDGWPGTKDVVSVLWWKFLQTQCWREYSRWSRQGPPTYYQCSRYTFYGQHRSPRVWRVSILYQCQSQFLPGLVWQEHRVGSSRLWKGMFCWAIWYVRKCLWRNENPEFCEREVKHSNCSFLSLHVRLLRDMTWWKRFLKFLRVTTTLWLRSKWSLCVLPKN